MIIKRHTTTMTRPLTIKEFSHEVKVNIYDCIKSDYEGEMTQEEFNDLVGDIKSVVIDDAINKTNDDEVVRFLCEFGIANAVNLFHAECGEWADVNERMLFYAIIDYNILYSLSHSDYIDWCENHCDCEEEVYYILSNYNLTQVEDKPSLDEYEEESRLTVGGRTEITYKKKESDEGGNDDDEDDE